MYLMFKIASQNANKMLLKWNTESPGGIRYLHHPTSSDNNHFRS